MAELLKDSLFSNENVKALSGKVKKFFPQFDEQKFLAQVFDSNWKNLELKQRMRHITIILNNQMNLSYKKSIKVLNKISEEYSGFAGMVLSDFVEVYGLDDFETSKKALKKFTSCCSSEFAVRPFIIKYGSKMMEEMYDWSCDSNHHVRRLASEGCRSRLPWGIALPEFKKDPAPVIPILEKLKNDSSEYVRKSVANNLNDISKDNPEIVLDIAENWYGNSKNTDWIVKHGLRTLLKKGNKRALELFGVSKKINFDVKNIRVSKSKIKINSEMEFGFEVVNKEKSETNFRVEYQIDFMKSNGKLSGKIFKISEITLKPDESKRFEKSFLFVNRTTRKLYPGKHIVSIIVNGIKKQEFEIFLEV